MQLKAWQKNIVSAIIIAVGGFILFNIAFILAAATSQVCSLFVRLFAGNNDFAINPIFSRYVFALIVLCISWFVFKSKLKTLVKATYLTMTLMVLLVLEGIRFYEQPKWVPISIGAFVLVSVIFYLCKKKLPWQYYFATIYTGVLALFVMIAKIDI